MSQWAGHTGSVAGDLAVLLNTHSEWPVRPPLATKPAPRVHSSVVYSAQNRAHAQLGRVVSHVDTNTACRFSATPEAPQPAPWQSAPTRLDGLASMWDHGTTPCSIFHREVFSVGALNSSAHAMVHPAAAKRGAHHVVARFSSVRGRLPPPRVCVLLVSRSLDVHVKFTFSAEKCVAMLVPIDMNRLPR